MNISVVGLGKLGSPIAAVLASKGHRIIGVDVNEEFVDLINKAIAPLKEPSLEEMLEEFHSNIHATTSYFEAVSKTDITLVILPTPSGEDGFFINSYLLDAMERIGSAIKDRDSYHLVVIKSTTMPGSCCGCITERLEKSSGKKVGNEMGLCYSPEFIALGSVIKNLLYPDLVLIGESDERAGDMLEKLYRTIVENTPTIYRTSIINAEIAKIAINTFVTTKISYANMIGEICQNIQGADAFEVLSAVGLDSRIGSKFLKAATGYGGPCFPRDNIALCSLAKHVGARSDLAEATDQINNYQTERLVNTVIMKVKDPAVAILGVSYKVGTHVIEKSPALSFAAALSEGGYQVSLYDPLAFKEAPKSFFGRWHLYSNLHDAVALSNCIVIMTPDQEFIDLIEPSWLKGKVVIDCWRILPEEIFGDECDLIYLGSGRGSRCQQAGVTHG